MSAATVEILIITILIVANGVFSMSETAIISVRKARLQPRAESGDEKARVALKLAQSPSNFLATVQIGITLIGILAGAFGGATVTQQLAVTIQTAIPALEPYAESMALTVVVIIITFFSLIVGELVPKNIALNNPEGVASAVAIPMQLLTKWVMPLVVLLNQATGLILRGIGIKPSEEPAVTEEEIKQMVKQGAQTGTFEKAESQIVEQVFRLDDLRVSSLMTPRTEIVWLDLDDAAEVTQRKIMTHGFACYPLIKDTPDNVIGIIWAKDLLSRHYRHEPIDLKATAIEPLFVPSGTTALRMLDIFKQADKHVALVIDEFGGLQGLITMNDVLYEIVGDAMSATNSEEPDIVRREDGSLLLDGMLLIDKLKEVLQVTTLPNEGSYETLGGFVMTQIGSVPTAGNHFETETWRFEVVDMDGHRVDKVLAQQKVIIDPNISD